MEPNEQTGQGSKQQLESSPGKSANEEHIRSQVGVTNPTSLKTNKAALLENQSHQESIKHPELEDGNKLAPHIVLPPTPPSLLYTLMYT